MFTITSVITIISMTKYDYWSWDNVFQIDNFFNPDRPIPLMIFCFIIAIISFVIEKHLYKKGYS
jgi:hypothetical protein